MTTPGEESPERPTPRRGSYDEVAPGVPRYGQYAPEGWEPPQDVKDARNASLPASNIPPAESYPGFGNHTAGTSPTGATTPETHLAPPGKVVVAVRLIMLAGILQALSVAALLVVLFVPSVKTSVIDVLQSSLASTPELAQVYSDPALVNTALFLAFLFSLAMAVTYFWLARAIRRGAGWARTTALVLGIISLAFMVQPNPLTIAQVVLGLVGVYLLYRTPAKEFFDAHKTRRAALRR